MTTLLAKTTAARNGVALSYRSVRGLYFLAVVFVRTIFCANEKNDLNVIISLRLKVMQRE